MNKQLNIKLYLLLLLKWMCFAIPVGIGLGWIAIMQIHTNYWGGPERTGKEQGTIYAVQTVESNVAFSSFAFKASYLINSGNTHEIQTLLNSAYGLFSFVVTDCKKKIGDCENEHILFKTNYSVDNKSKSWWLDKYFIKTKKYKESLYDFLRSPAPVFQETGYEAPKNATRKTLLKKGHPQLEDEIIGRIYYVRRNSRSFSEQIAYWWHQDLSPTSTDAKHYSKVLLEFIFFSVIFSFFLARYEYNLRVSNDNEIALKDKSLEDERKLAFEKQKLIETETKHRLELEDLMAMFAHKFRGPLDSLDFNFQNGCLDQVRFLRSLETMRGLLNTFSMISTSPDEFKQKIKVDISGSQSIKDVLFYSLEYVIGHLTSANKMNTIHQHYLCYAKKQDIIDISVDEREWAYNYALQELELQKTFSSKFLEYEHKEEKCGLLSFTKNFFFELEIKGLEDLNIHFNPFETKSSLLTIIFSEVLTNAFKYYSSETHAPVTLQYFMMDDNICFTCSTPSSRMERSNSKGSGKGHFFIKRLTEMLGGTFSFTCEADSTEFCVTEIQLPQSLFFTGD